MKWEKASIKDICLGIYDGPHATPPLSDTGGIFLGIPNFVNGRLDLNNVRYISEKDLPKWTKRVTPKENDIVFSYEATLNLYAIIPEGFYGCLGRRMGLLRVDNSKVFYKFLYYYFFSERWQRVIKENTVLGSTVDRLPLIKFPDFPVFLPSLQTQYKIASILSAYDDLIENNQKQIKLLEEAAQRLYKEWFVDLRFPGHEGVKVVDGVPEGWNKVRLDEVTSVLKRGISPKYDENGEFTVINQKCIRKNIVDYSESRKQSKKYAEELQLQESDTVICSTGIGTLGRVGQIYNVYQNSTFDSHVTLVRANKLIGKQFLFWSLKLLQPYLMSLGKGSTNQQELYKSDLTACFLLLPEEYIMNAFERQAQELHDIIAVKSKQISSLREARDRLLPKLMSGEIEV